MRRMVPGTRVTVAQLLAELANDLKLSDLDEDRDWSMEGMRDALLELARDIDADLPAREAIFSVRALCERIVELESVVATLRAENTALSRLIDDRISDNEYLEAQLAAGPVIPDTPSEAVVEAMRSEWHQGAGGDYLRYYRAARTELAKEQAGE